MEIHHYPHVGRKTFMQYFLEFILIFLAVMLGFFGENLREKIADHSKEKEYIISMIEDARIDTANIRQAIELNNNRIRQLDSLSWMCNSYNTGKNSDAEIYRHFKPGLIHPAFVAPTERTMQQLKNAGGMRLIRSKTSVDIIVLYDDAAKKLVDQQAYYELYQNKSIDIGSHLFDFQRYLGFGASDSNLRTFTDLDTSVRLLNYSRENLVQFANIVEVYAGIVHFYNVRLQEMHEHAVRLIQTLQQEYHLREKLKNR